MLNKLVRGQKYTLVGNDGMLEFNIQITLIDYMYMQYAQYEDVPYITYKKKGGRKVYSMILNYKYSFIAGWQDISLSKKIDDYSSERIKYDDLKLDNVLVTGQVGTTDIYKEYESLIDHSSNIAIEYGVKTDKYYTKLKEVFTHLNYSLSKDMISYYKTHASYFLPVLEGLYNNIG